MSKFQIRYQRRAIDYTEVAEKSVAKEWRTLETVYDDWFLTHQIVCAFDKVGVPAYAIQFKG